MAKPRKMPRGRPKKKKVKKKLPEIPLENTKESELIQRITECQQVIGEIGSSPLWTIVVKDLDAQRRMLDDNWQGIVEPVKLQEARILKFATMHILNLKQKYQEELGQLTVDLEAMQNTKKAIIKDYDTET